MTGRPRREVREDQGEAGEKPDVVARRAMALERLLGGRVPWLVPWLPALGLALGLGAGLALWVVIDEEWLFLREALLVVTVVLGIGAGRVEQARVGEYLDALMGEPPEDLPKEFRDQRVPSTDDRRHEMLRGHWRP